MEEENIWLQRDPKEIERLISPFRYIAAKNKQAALDNHVFLAHEETSLARTTVPCTLHVPYGQRDEELFDIYGTDLAPTSPTFLWVHGGAWVTGSKEWSGLFVRNAHRWGFRSIIVGYVLMPDANGIREMCRSVEQAVKKAMSLFPMAKFIIGGHSAGAQIVANILCRSSGGEGSEEASISEDAALVQRISGFALYSGLMDMRSVQNTEVNELLKLSEEEAHLVSPLLNTCKIARTWLEKRVPLKILIAMGRFDPPEFQRQGKDFADRLRRRGFVDVEYWVCLDSDHFTIIENFLKAETPSGAKFKEFLHSAVSSNVADNLRRLKSSL